MYALPGRLDGNVHAHLLNHISDMLEPPVEAVGHVVISTYLLLSICDQRLMIFYTVTTIGIRFVTCRNI